MRLAFPSLFGFGSTAKVPEKFKPTCHIFYGMCVIDINDDLLKRVGHKNRITKNIIMAFGKCEKCERPVKVKQSGKKYILPLFFFFSGLLTIAYERDLGNTNPFIVVPGGLSVTAGFVWLIVKGIRYISN